MLPEALLKKIQKFHFTTKRMANDMFAGQYESAFKGRGMEFAEVREYQIGDDIRTIDWNVTARTGEPYVKRYIEERELTVMLVVDASASENFGSIDRFKRELAAELTAVLSFAATNNNDTAFGSCLARGQWPKQGNGTGTGGQLEKGSACPASHGCPLFFFTEVFGD